MKSDRNDIDQFFEALNSTPENVDIKKVHQLLNQPTTVARWSETNAFKPLKILIMTSIITAAIIAWLTWPITEKTEIADQQFNPPVTEQKSKPPASEEEKGLNTAKREIPLKKVETVEPIQHESVDPKIDVTKFDQKSTKKVQPRPEKDQATPMITEPLEPEICNWPEDTVFEADKLIVDLSLKELMELGFQYDWEEDSIYALYYHNLYGNTRIAFHRLVWPNRGGERSAVGADVHRRNIAEIKHLDFYPLYETDFTTDITSSSITTSNSEAKHMNDTLVGVRIKKDLIPYAIGETTILWFKTSSSFFDALPDHYASLEQTMSCIRTLKTRIPDRDIVLYENKYIVSTGNALELPKDKLESMGMQFSEDGFSISFIEDNCRVSLWFNKSEGSGVSLGAVADQGEEEEFCIKYLSNKRGRQGVQWSCGGSHEKMGNAYFIKDYETLIPVVLRKEKYPDQLSEDKYLWFKPTPEFLAIIPGEIGEQIRSEYEYLMSEDKTGLESSCNFFEACRATLHLHDLNIYPNPSQGDVSVKFTSPEAMSTDISISDMNGREVLEIARNRYLSEGVNQIGFDVSGLPSGIYLFVLHGEKGFMTRRLIVQ